LKNKGSVPAVVSSTLFIIDVLEPLTDTIHISGGSFSLMEDRMVWEVEINPGQTETATLLVHIGSVLQTQSIPILLVLEDEATTALVRWDELTIHPYRYYFPFAVTKSG
jgi:hypothetical protein